MGGFVKALPLVIIVALASGHLEYDHEAFWNPPAVLEWKQNLATEEPWNKKLAVEDRSSRHLSSFLVNICYASSYFPATHS